MVEVIVVTSLRHGDVIFSQEAKPIVKQEDILNGVIDKGGVTVGVIVTNKPWFPQ
jgi:hypothetical protein